jgi:hypothetical protein
MENKMNTESMNTDKESVERPEDKWIERFSSFLVGALMAEILPGKWGKELNAFISTVIGYDLKKLASLPPKMFNNLLYDLFYEKQYKEYWNSNREEIYKNILRQTELFSLNAKISNMDIESYIKQWIEKNPKYAMQFDAMMETAISYSQKKEESWISFSQKTGGNGEGWDVIDFYKKQVLSLMNWKEKYDRVYSTTQKPTSPSATPNMNISQKKNQQKTDVKKTFASPEAEQPSIGIESISVALSEKMDSTGYSGSGFSLGDFGKLDLEIGAAINLEKDDLTPALENVAAKTEEIINNVPVEEVTTFSESLRTASSYGHQIAAAFMNVDENIGKAIGSAGTLTEGIGGIFKAFEGEEVNGLGLMSGIRGGFVSIQPQTK